VAQLTRPARKAMFAAGVWRGSRGVTSDKRNRIAAIPKAASHPLTIRAQRFDPAPLSISFGDITNGRIEQGGYLHGPRLFPSLSHHGGHHHSSYSRSHSKTHRRSPRRRSRR
jgi:hypothetical protein